MMELNEDWQKKYEAEETLAKSAFKLMNYRSVEPKCCSTCEYSFFDYYESMNCKLVYNKDFPSISLVSFIGLCDLYKRKQNDN